VTAPAGPATLSAPPATTWPAAWLTETAQPRSSLLWRGVEAQHIVATMRLVDTLDEQAVLERLLEDSKPALPRPPAPAPTAGPRSRPVAAAEPHYLLATPFRYSSPFPSRFRRPHHGGIWYGAETLRTAAAEVAYWRWRFLLDSEGLRGSELHTEHSFFQARVEGLAIDLVAPPWDSLAALWTQDRDYTATHALGDAARNAGLHWLRYASVREPGGHCGAVFSVQALALHAPHWPQTWHCKTTAHSVWLLREDERYAWAFARPTTGTAPS
jgi:RES domain